MTNEEKIKKAKRLLEEIWEDDQETYYLEEILILLDKQTGEGLFA